MVFILCFFFCYLPTLICGAFHLRHFPILPLLGFPFCFSPGLRSRPSPHLVFPTDFANMDPYAGLWVLFFPL